MRSPDGFRVIALFEAGKGALVLVAGLGLFGLLHNDSQDVAEVLVRHLHLDPASQAPRVLAEAISAWSPPPRLRLLAAAALGYVLLRFVEAYGLWRARRWAAWLAAGSAGIYLPLELCELQQGLTWLRASLFTANLMIVAFLLWSLLRRQAAGRAADGGISGP